MSIPTLLSHFDDLRTGPEDLYHKFEQTATTTTTAVACLKRDWADDTTQTALRCAKRSVKADSRIGPVGLRRWVEISDVFPANIGREGNQMKQEDTKLDLGDQEVETAPEKIDIIVDTFRAGHPTFSLETSTGVGGYTIKVCKQKQPLENTDHRRYVFQERRFSRHSSSRGKKLHQEVSNLECPVQERLLFAMPSRDVLNQDLDSMTLGILW